MTSIYIGIKTNPQLISIIPNKLNSAKITVVNAIISLYYYNLILSLYK